MTTMPFTNDRASLSTYRCPDWFRDAKFGIWSHWGPQCVPGEDDWEALAPLLPGEHVDHILPGPGEWYARHMYVQGHRAYRHHLARFGHPSRHGWKDVIPHWKAERFDPERLAKRYAAAGARYLVSMAVHHDNFDLWESRHQTWNAACLGPRRDIVGAWRAAAQANGLRFGVSEHLSASYSWFQTSHGADQTGPLAGVAYDGADPAFQTLYHPSLPCFTEHVASQWYTQDAAAHRRWEARMRDLIEQHDPDFLYTDGGIPFGTVGRDLMAWFYNRNQSRRGSLQAVYAYKDIGSGEFFPEGGVQDVERGGLDVISPLPWQTDTTLGGWFHWSGQHYRPTADIIHSLADIVSRNGNLLLNLPQRADGTLPPACDIFLDEMAGWMAVHGEAIHGTRPWHTAGEGPTPTAGGHFNEGTRYTAQDVRYTTSTDGRRLYVIALGCPQRELRLAAPVAYGHPLGRVRLVGSVESIAWRREGDHLVLPAPQRPPSDLAVAWCLEAGG